MVHGRDSLVEKKNSLAEKRERLNFIIRAFQFPEDYPEIYALWQSAGPGIQVRKSDEPDEILKKLDRDPDLFLVAESENQIIGSVVGGFDGRRGMVYHLAVSDTFRQHGVGAALMAALEERLRNKGCIRYYLLVKRDNVSAIKFYENLGWQSMDLNIFGKDIESRN